MVYEFSSTILLTLTKLSSVSLLTVSEEAIAMVQFILEVPFINNLIVLLHIHSTIAPPLRLHAIWISNEIHIRTQSKSA